MGDTCVPSLIVIGIAIKQLETKVSLKTMLPEATCCCLQACNFAASEQIVGERCLPSLIDINSTINKL